MSHTFHPFTTGLGPTGPSTIWPGSIGTEQHCRGQTSAWAVMCPRLSRGQGSHAFRDLMCKDRSRGAVEHRCESGTVPPL